ncbi:hypothetical protein B0H11DRAFT_1993576, partial [Mycena galericulata]
MTLFSNLSSCHCGQFHIYLVFTLILCAEFYPPLSGSLCTESAGYFHLHHCLSSISLVARSDYWAERAFGETLAAACVAAEFIGCAWRTRRVGRACRQTGGTTSYGYGSMG